MPARPQILSWNSILLALPLAVALPGRAQALQPLQQFVKASREHNPNVRQSQASARAQKAQADVALGHVLPAIQVRGVYARNQYDTKLMLPQSLLDPSAPAGAATAITLTPFNQLSATGTLSVPLIDLSNFRRISAARTAADAAAQQTQAVQLQVEAQVVQGYYQLLANLALVQATQHALDVARAGEQMAQTRVQLGQAPALEADRAKAEVERQVQQLAAVNLQVAVAAQGLQSATGITPELAGPVALHDDLQEEPGVERFRPSKEGTPAMAAAAKAHDAALAQASAQRLQLVPSLAGSFTENIANSAGFSGHDASFQAALALTWYADYSLIAAIHAADAQADVAAAQQDAARLAADDAIHDAWSAVHAAIARSRSAQIQQQVAHRAEQLAADRYRLGASTQLDLLSAQRDAFGADAARIQADADLANARAQLRIASGHPLFADTSGDQP